MSGIFWVCSSKYDVDNFGEYVKTHWDFSRSVELSYKRHSQRRGLEQNSLFHVWVRQITKHISGQSRQEYTEAWVKTYIKRRWGLRDDMVDPFTGEELPSLKSTADYTTGELYHLMCQVEAWAAEIGCTLSIWGEYESIKKDGA